jgi:hypothetical protein
MSMLFGQGGFMHRSIVEMRINPMTNRWEACADFTNNKWAATEFMSVVDFSDVADEYMKMHPGYVPIQLAA